METTYKAFLKSGFWGDVRYRKLEVNPRCERCNSTRKIQVHHKVYRGWYKVQLEDLETLCERCHKKEHGKPLKGPSMDEASKLARLKKKIRKITRSLRKSEVVFRPKELRDGSFTKYNGRIVFNPR